jgi:putative transposase
VPAAGTNRKICVYGALNYRSAQAHYLTRPKKNAAQFNDFLKQLLEARRGRFLVLVMDNASYHVTRATLEILTEHAEHIFVIWLPKYSPELNAIEGLWGYMKKSALNNYFFGTVESLEKAIDEAFEELNQHPETTLSLTYTTSRNLYRTA